MATHFRPTIFTTWSFSVRLIWPTDLNCHGFHHFEKTLMKPTAGQIFARVVNLRDGDVCLSPRTRIGVFHVADRVHNPKHGVEISRISVNEAEVNLNSNKARQTKATSCPVDLTDVNCTPMDMRIFGMGQYKTSSSMHLR